jgi:hypothetical protein
MTKQMTELVRSTLSEARSSAETAADASRAPKPPGASRQLEIAAATLSRMAAGKDLDPADCSGGRRPGSTRQLPALL